MWLLLAATQGCSSPSVSSDRFVNSLKGQLLFEDFSSKDGTWYVMDFSRSAEVRQIDVPKTISETLGLSPDGNMNALQVGATVDGQWVSKGIQVVDTRTGQLIFDFAESSATEPAWSLDSSRLAFVANLASGEYSGGTIKGMYSDVFYVDLRSKTHAIVNVTETSRFSKIPAPLTELGGISIYNPIWSPDGKAIASVWHQDDGETIWVASVDGNDWARLVGGTGHEYRLVEWRP